MSESLSRHPFGIHVRVARGCAWTALLICALALVGCNRGPARYPVSGAVSWKGEPIQEGDIIFEPEDPNHLPETGKVVNGHYEMKVTAGRKKVRLFASREKAGANKAMGPGEREAIIPPDYNARSAITAEVTATGPNQFDFHLPMKK
jgi:hypothetical protein